ncbi:MAG: GtrA family protein [Acidobacteria bacterium]|nr:GtrA family protein [Acidobacteriota bacterium]
MAGTRVADAACRRRRRVRPPDIVRRLQRWLVFNAVGTMGVAVQLTVLLSLTEALGLNYLVATVLAVESAILHNFVWHEHWTWRDRGPGSRGRWTRLAWFNLVTGALSISSNVVFTALYVNALGVHYAIANLMAVATCSLLTFVANDRFVFRTCNEGEDMMTGGSVSKKQDRRPIWRFATLRAGLAVVLAAACTQGLAAAELQDETLAAWERYVRLTEQRIANELDDADARALEVGTRFLAQDFRDDAAGARRDVLAGDVRIDRMATRDADGNRIRVPKGAIHHWRGSVLIPGATLDAVLRDLMHGADLTGMQNGVVESRVLDRDGDRLHVFLKLRRKQLITVHYNTEHRVRYTRHRPDAASSRSVSTRIAELVDAGSPAEREKPIGRDRGFLWRLNSYWRYQQTDAGVIVECESVSLSRSIPRAVRWMATPIVNRTARQVMTRTLTSVAAAMHGRGPSGIGPAATLASRR